jgi:7-carboxy-7-deazaguanine synthase
VKTVKVFETFTSLQGESTYTGMPCFFIRLSGCNLRCSYCDTSGAWEGGEDRPICELISEAEEAGCPLVEVTGGEPLIQEGIRDLLEGLAGLEGVKVLVETNGTQDISVLPDEVSAIMDIKCPSSGQTKWFDESNIGRLRPQDEVKFVVAEWDDYEWARNLMREHALAGICNAVLFGAVHGVLEASALAEWICEDRLNARFQLQLHKVIGHQ